MTSLSNQSTKQSDGFLVYYQGFLAVAAVLVFFTKLDGFFEAYGYGIPLFWLCGFVVASIPLFSNIGSRIQHLPLPIIIWSGFYLAFSAIIILFSPQLPDMQILEDLLRSIIALFLMILIFSQSPRVLHWSRVAILAVTLMNVVNHIYEFINPMAFGALHIIGRPAGFYINSNQAGCALITGMILTIDMIKPRYRILYAIFVLSGIALTFSRGSIMSWFLVLGFLLWQRVIPKYQTIYLGVAMATLIMILLSNANNLAYVKNADGTDLFNEDTLRRVEFLTDPLSEEQDTSRLDIADESWRKFTERPFLGQGLGGSANPNHLSVKGNPQKPHNIYLTLLVEYGFLGFFLYPTLLLACIWKMQGEFKPQGFAFVIFFLIWGVFSHTVLDSYFTLLLFAFIANLTARSREQIQ